MADGNSLTMETREEPRFINFATGDTLEGELLSVEEVTIKEKRAVRYTLKEPDRDIWVCFLGTHMLNSKLRLSDVGHYIQITCEGEDTTVKKGENCMKVFDVKVSREKVHAGLFKPTALKSESGDGTGITDEDLPF